MTTWSEQAARIATDWGSQDLLDGLPAAVYVCDADAVVVAYNRRAAELWGRAPALGDTDEKYCGSLRLYRPDGTFMPHAATPMEEVLRTAKPAKNKEVTIERPDGSRVTVLVNIAPLLDENGRLVGAVNCFQDLTARKAAEEERARLAAELHQAQKLEALGQLTAGLAHDFNNILTALIGNLELLRTEIAGNDGAQRLLENAVRSAGRGAVLNGQLLAFARKQTLLPQAIDLNKVLQRMTSLVRTTVGDLIRLEMREPQGACEVLVDPTQIELAILNLALNARDAMPQGGTLTLETRNETASGLPDLADGDYAVLSVGDTGTGMSEEIQKRAVEPFFTTKDSGRGTGLGLSMVLGLAKQSGGGVRISSRVGEGTRVSVFLPRAGMQVASPARQEHPITVLPAGGGEVVLVVDDDADVREVTAEILNSGGYAVVTAASGTEALEMIASEQRIDLMLIDVAMPEMNGIEVARMARARRSGLPVLLSSGYTDLGRFGTMSAPCEQVIQKPYRLADLLRKVRGRLGTPSRQAAPARESPIAANVLPVRD